MKRLIVVAALVATSTSAMAVETVMGIKGRFDYINTKTDSNPGKASSGVLTTSFLRLVTDAKINDTTSAKLTLDFQPNPNGTSDNNVQNLVDEAYLTKSFAHGLTLMFGKQAVMTGGRENDYSTRDLYLVSKFKSEIVDNITGVSAGYSMAGQNLFLQYLQQTDARKTPLTDKKVIGAAYYGEFMDKMIMPILSYHKQGTSRVGAYDDAGSAGLRLTAAKVMLEADYLMLKQEKLSTTLGDAKLNSVVAHLRYVHENFQPFAKFITEKGKKGYQGIVAGSTESKRTAWEVGVEYMPNKDEDMRYHVVYNNSESKNQTTGATGAGAKVEEQKIIAGVAFNYNILK
ncbi:MAG: hypothetical protein H7177_03780 [Rhizobacter sp.]|nr:hypothetical protein [Bacteriovorax sp.]